MNILIDGAPNAVEIDGEMWRINTDFRAFLLLEDLIRTGDIPDRYKTGFALAYFYPRIPKNLGAAVDRLLWFYHCGEEDGGKGSEEKKKERPLYSFSQDASDIYAAFWERYRIDLTTETLHWWKFNALLRGLVSGVGFSDIVKFRAAKIPRGMAKEEASYYRRMKKIYALKEEDTADKTHKESYEEFKDEILSKAQARRAEVQKQTKRKPPG